MKRPYLLAGLAALSAAACTKSNAARPPASTPVRVAKAVRINAPISLAASGVVEPMQTVAVTTLVTGVLFDVAFHEGDFVKTGDVLFHIDPRPLEAEVDQARANLARDEAQLTAARNDDARYQTLAGKGYVTQSDADQHHATALATAASVNADRATLRGALLNLEHATIRSPISGRTGSLIVRPGNVVSPTGGPLVVINQLKPVLVRFPVPDQQFPGVQRAVATHPLLVRAASKDSADTPEMGQLSFLDNAVDSLTGIVTAKATFPNESGRLWPGELLFLDVQIDVRRHVLAVPTPAILPGQDSSYVFVIVNNVAAQRTVSAGPDVQGMTVIDRGLKDGDVVVVDGQSRLTPGTRVSVLRDSGDTARTRAVTTESASPVPAVTPQ
jgi:membrane fusion protein, multidrug efflux system